VDIYDPGNHRLTIQTATVGPATRHNVLVTLASGVFGLAALPRQIFLAAMT
jgi:hypothetical protein